MIALLIISLVLAAATIAATFMSVRWASCLALAALVFAFIGLPASEFRTSTFISWIVACVGSAALCYMIPRREAENRRGVGYLAMGAILGAIITYFISPGYFVAGIIIGALFGAFAYGRTPAGRSLLFPSGLWLRFVGSKGLPVMICLAVAFIVIMKVCISWAA